MKYLLSLFFCLILTPVFALCSLESDVCSLPSYQQQTSPLFNSNQKSNIDNLKPKVKELNKENSFKQSFKPNQELEYNSGCQFGVCVQDLNNTLLKSQ